MRIQQPWSCKAQYTLATKLNSTRSTLSKVFDKVYRVALAPYTLETKSKGRLTFGRQKSPIFNKVDQVEHIQRQCRLRQTVEFDFVASRVRTGDKAETS